MPLCWRCSTLPLPAPGGTLRISFLIPAFNERATIGEVLERIDALGLERQIIVVDDGSTDGTEQALESWRGRDGVLILRQAKNLGKGAAIRAAIPSIDGEIAVIQDADMEYDPATSRRSSSRSNAARPTSSTGRASRAGGPRGPTCSGTSSATASSRS